MDNLSIFLFAIAGISTLVGAFYLMASAANSKPVRDYNAGRLSGTWTTEVKKPVHPEMRDVEPGTQLMGVNFQQKTECNLEEYKALQARIEELRVELGGELDIEPQDFIEGDDEEDEDDDGDVVVRV
tara:strand:+ start:83 stop:463 length:381 start_codon:yes stop_codon:yes gene_type:complete